MPTSVLVTVSFWRILLERLGRQAAQTAVPFLAAVVAAGGVVDVRTVATGLGGILAVTAVKGLIQHIAHMQVTPGTSMLWRWLDRAAPAAAGVVAGLLPNDWQGLLTMDWTSALYAAAAAAGLAILSLYTNPPALAPARRTADGAYVITSAPSVDVDGLGGDA